MDINPCGPVLPVQGRWLPSWPLAECQRWERVCVQEGRAQTTGDLPVRAHHLLRGATALHLQDHCGRARDVLWNTTGSCNRGTDIHWYHCIYLMCCCCWKVLQKSIFLLVLPGWRDHKDHESLHQHDCEEALQREVGLQLRQQLDQVMAGGEAARRCSQAPQAWRFRAFHPATRTGVVGRFSHPAVVTLVIPHTRLVSRKISSRTPAFCSRTLCLCLWNQHSTSVELSSQMSPKDTFQQQRSL